MHTPHDKVRSAALQKTNPTLEEVMQIASLYETTVKTCSELKGDTGNNMSVNAVRSSNQPNRQRYSNRSKSKSKYQPANKSCTKCGISHQRSECFHFLNKTKCRECGNLGHLAAVCQKSTKNQRANVNQNKTQMMKK